MISTKVSFPVAALGVALVLATGCGRKSNPAGDFPDGFDDLPDSRKVDYVIMNASPDSAARFIINASIGEIEGVRIDSLQSATLYAYEKLHDKDFERFSIEFDRYSHSLPLPKKMRVLREASTDDPQQLGYTLGLEYIASIREKGMGVEEVRRELNEFKRACGSDRDTYRRFILGFRTALEADHGKDLPEDIYTTFINEKVF